MLTQHYAMLQRNLLYTGVTRGKRLVVLVASHFESTDDAFIAAVARPARRFQPAGPEFFAEVI